MTRNEQNAKDRSPFSFYSDAPDVPGQKEEPATQGTAERRRRRKRRADRTSAGDASADSLFSAPRDVPDDPGVAYGYRKSIRGHSDEVSAYTQHMDARHAMDRRSKVLLSSAVALIILIPLVAVLPTGLFGSGRPPVTLALLIQYTSDNVTGLVNWLTGGPVTTGISIYFWQILAVAVAGAALALNGCVFQGALKNALAAPSTLGVMSGGTIGTLIYTLAFTVPDTYEAATVSTYSETVAEFAAMSPLTYLVATQGRALCSIVGCITVVALVLLIAHIAGRGRVSKVALLIAGQVFTAVITGVIAVVRTYIMHYGTIQQQEALRSIVGGDVSGIVDPFTLLLLAVPVAIGVVIIMVMRFRLNILAFNDEEARSMGLKTIRVRNFAVLVCTVLTGVVVSFVGSVGFVGFLVPHLARKVVGPDFRYLIPVSLVFGAVFLVLAHYFMNLTSLFGGNLGILTTLLGAVCFLVIVVRQRARGNVDWI